MKNRIAMIGDSHSQILFPLLASSLRSKGHEIVYQVSNAGWGVKSYNQRPDIVSDLVQTDPDVVIVSLGGNNQKTDDRYREDVKTFIKSLGAKSIVWIGPFYSTRDDVQRRHQWTDLWLKHRLPSSARYIQTMDISKDGHTDQVHFTRSKYKQIHDYVLSKISIPIRLPPVLYRHRKPIIATLTLGLVFGIYKGIQWSHHTKRLKST